MDSPENSYNMNNFKEIAFTFPKGVIFFSTFLTEDLKLLLGKHFKETNELLEEESLYIIH